MTYYKVIKDGKVIDVLDKIIYLKYQKKHNMMILCEESDNAEAIMSSDQQYIWHEESLYQIPVEGYDTVQIEEIDKYEYDQLKMLNLKSVSEIIDQYTLSLIEGGIL